jgi:hypothetical protein
MTLEEFKNKYRDLIIQLQEHKRKREPLDQICLPKEIKEGQNIEPVAWKDIDRWYELYKEEEKIVNEIVKLCHEYYLE